MQENWPKCWNSHIKKNIPDLPPVMLFIAPVGLHLNEFVNKLARNVLCSETDDLFSSCDSCPSCQWCFNGHHPDIKIIKPTDTKDNEIKKPSEKGEIKINQIRQISNFIHLSSHQSGSRIVCIGPAEKLNYPASNALLKTLEEPPEKMHFLFFAHSLKGLASTMLSRCRKIFLPFDRAISYKNYHSENEVLKWLLPLLRMQDKVDPCLWAKKAGKTPPHETILILIMWMTDISRINIGLKSVCFPEESDSTKGISDNLHNLTNWVEATVKIQDMIEYSNHPLNLTLFYESIFYEYQNGFN